MATCGIALYGRDEDKRRGVTARAGCDKWSCKDCAQRKAKRLMARAIHGMTQDERQWYLVTITSRARGFAASLAAFKTGYRKVYKAMKAAHKNYALSGDMMFLKIFERHKDGTLHVHIITDVNWQSRRRRRDDGRGKAVYIFMPRYAVKRKDGSVYFRSSFLADKCSFAGLGYIGECRPLNAQSGHVGYIIAAYVAKYLTKDMQAAADDWPRYSHRVEFSANWPQLPPLENEDDYIWHVARRALILSDKLNHWHIDDQADILSALGL